ncbi:hypothetical protein DESUT3_18500 [Desulfuromonas versatilis]|uniref:Uncharacterized protein n=1 Tax=Desulfuromonas versatilis TaxID=2802975 RepID=A0ABM8HW43_9BACT|nr:hypothetical protein [Desulfuromonas versatilis]BCR04781.1 hypothetical protein DESUT3_18500 [Desulfuromonas versatilis]
METSLGHIHCGGHAMKKFLLVILRCNLFRALVLLLLAWLHG